MHAGQGGDEGGGRRGADAGGGDDGGLSLAEDRRAPAVGVVRVDAAGGGAKRGRGGDEEGHRRGVTAGGSADGGLSVVQQIAELRWSTSNE